MSEKKTLKFYRSGVKSDLPLVLLHALPLDASMWNGVLREMPDTDVITVDAPGFGGSAPAAEFCATPDLGAYVDALKATLDSLGVTQILLGGLSMGGAVAADFVLKYPQTVKALALMDTNIGADSDASRAGRIAIAEKAEAGKGYEAVQGWTRKMVSPNVTQSVRESLDCRLRRLPNESLAWMQRGMAARTDATQAVQLIDGPVYFVRGEDDVTCSLETLLKWSLKAKHPRVEEIPNAGHFSADEQPAVLAGILTDFVKAAKGDGKD